MNHPETQYVEVGDADVAYQVLGSGPDLLFCYGLGSHVEFNWQVPLVGAFFERLASVVRLITFDRRGTGASDGVPRSSVPTLEEWTEDIAAVLDATGAEQAAILSTLETGPIAMLYAAMHPERVRALVLMNTFARYVEDGDYPEGVPEDVVDLLVEWMATDWGTTALLAVANPTADPEFLERVAPVTRASATPRTAAAQYRYMLRHDVRHVLPLIAAPTLVLHVAEQPFTPLPHGRYIADHIDGARLVVLPGRRPFVDDGEPGRRRRGGRVPHRRATGGGDRPGPRHGAVHRHRGLDASGGGGRRPAVAPRARRPRPGGP